MNKRTYRFYTRSISGVCILIPSRLDSKRFPEKSLSLFFEPEYSREGKAALYKEVTPKTLIQKVYDKCASTGIPTYVVTDSQKIVDSLDPDTDFILTKDEHENGTSRCAEAAKILNGKYDYYVNIQGDMIDITEDIIMELAMAPMITKLDGPFTCYTEMNMTERQNPHNVKVIHNGSWAHWFCRAALDYGDWHLGVYGYKKNYLLDYPKYPQTNPEFREGLEQLRWIDNDIKMHLIKVNYDGMEINTPKDRNDWHEKQKRDK